jgi:hypothetical protein
VTRTLPPERLAAADEFEPGLDQAVIERILGITP